jgi:coproporphyrinogen III oxidase-like Fe-S oxidoreductase
MGLRLTQGVDLSAIRSVYGVDVLRRYSDELSRFVDAGLLDMDGPGERLCLTRQGMLLANEIMMVFIGGAVR